MVCLLLVTACTRKGSDDVPALADTGRDNASLYDQGNTPCCWIYAMCACIEREQRRSGDDIRLSRQWLLARYAEEQTRRAYIMARNGEPMPATTDSRSAFTMRGVGPETMRLISCYGLVPFEHERSRVNNGSVLARRLTGIARTVVSPQELDQALEDNLPRFTVSRQTNTFFYFSMRYTPQQFAESIMYHQRWQFYASEEMHPWGERFALEIPDNYRYHEYTNLPMDSIESMVLRSLRAGHPVYWEYGKKARESAHAMAIIGLTTDKKTGKPMLVCLNSYGLSWGNKGRCAVSLDFFRRHTCNVGVLSLD